MAACPARTAVRKPLEDIVAEAGRLVLASVEDRALWVSSVIYEPTLVTRQSA